MLKQGMLLAALSVGVLLGAAREAQSAYIVDTGTPPAGTPANSIFNLQSVAGQFTVAASYVVTSVEGYLYDTRVSDVPLTIALHGPNGNVPGTVLYEASFNPGTVVSWQGVFGLDWAIAPGTYWVSFSSDDVNGAGLHRGAPSPLDEYGVSNQTGWRNLGPNGWDHLALAIRIAGDEIAPSLPLPGTLPLLAVALAGVAAVRRRRMI